MHGVTMKFIGVVCRIESTEIFTLFPTAKRYRDFLETFRHLNWYFAVPRTVGRAVFIDIPLTT